MMFWMKDKFFRNAEGEGAGGAGGEQSSPEGASTAPDTIANLQERLNRLTQSMEGMTREQRQRGAQEAIISRDNELSSAKRKAEDAVTAAEQTLATAYDNGEGVEIAKAQRALTEAVAKRERADIAVEQFRDQVKNSERKSPKEGPADDGNLRAWKAKNANWYGVDAEMTKATHEIDRQIRAAGVLSVGSEEYFRAVDKQMSNRYPDKFGGTPQTGGAGGSSNPSASQRPGSGRIQQSIAEGWRRMGIDMSDPKVVDRMLQNRETAVKKGILSSTPHTGSIITR
jgi:hypothetical protein